MPSLQHPDHGVVAFALHKHEHKYSVVHFTVLRNTEFEDDVRSKVCLSLGSLPLSSSDD